MSPDSPRIRFGAVGIVTLSLFAALFARLWFLQVMVAPEYQVAAENNRVRVVQEEAPRGRILDRKGNVLVDNRRAIVVSIDWQDYVDLEPPDQDRLLTKLGLVLTRDRDRQARGEVAPGDPGALPVPSEGDEADEADEGSTTTTSTTTTTEPPEGTVTTDGAGYEPVTADVLRSRLDDARFSRFEPIPVATDVSEDLELYLTANAAEFPTVAVERVTVRNYVYGQLLAHVLGYVGSVNEDELAQFQNDAKPYENDDQIGKAGVERAMEERLRGVPGEVRYEVDARNRPIRRLPGGRESVPGDDVYLSIDIDLQYVTEKSLAAQLSLSGTVCDARGCFDGSRSGSAVVTDPASGQVLSMASYPTFDPSEFVGGIGTDAYAQLTAEGNQNPLENKAIAGQYAPGSTWKLFSAHAGLTYNQIAPDTVVYDPGYYVVRGCEIGDCERQNAGRTPHGTVNLQSALTVSSDVYFYKLGDDLWARRGEIGDDAFARAYATWGFGEKTDLGLTGETAGRLPTPEWKREFAAQLYEDDPEKAEEYGKWYSGDNLNVSIGQGDVLVTPLQLANGYGTFANGGTRYQPQLVLQVTEAYSSTVVEAFQPIVVSKLDMRPEWYTPMLEGFKGVTLAGGTAGRTFEGFPQDSFPVAGKTGTAQVNGKADTSLFAAFAPADAPRFAAAAILPEGGNGGDAAAPLIRRILEPLAAVGGDLARLPKAPIGGSFDAEAVASEIEAPPSDGLD